MTGSGKTGLCIDLLEEAALEGIPAIVVDPKGDMANLLLTFPGLRPEEFCPWVNLDDAWRKGLSPDEYAQEVASTWARGLEEWRIGPERLQRLRDAAEFAIYTASRKRRMTQQAKADVEESLEAIEDLEAQIQDLREELEEEIAEVTERWAETIDVVKKVEVRAKKADISVEAFGLAWVPHWRVTYEYEGVTQQPYLPAYDKIREANDDQRF